MCFWEFMLLGIYAACERTSAWSTKRARAGPSARAVTTGRRAGGMRVHGRTQPGCACGSSAGLYKEFTPWGQGQGRDFDRGLAEPSQAGRGGTAVPDSTKGLPQPGPAATTGPVQHGAKICQQGAKSPVMATSGEEHAYRF